MTGIKAKEAHRVYYGLNSLVPVDTLQPTLNKNAMLGSCLRASPSDRWGCAHLYLTIQTSLILIRIIT